MNPIMEILELHLPRRNKLDNIALAAALTDCCFDRKIKVKSLIEERDELAAMIDGAKPIIEIWKAKSPAQATWAKEWLEKANVILKEEK